MRAQEGWDDVDPSFRFQLPSHSEHLQLVLQREAVAALHLRRRRSVLEHAPKALAAEVNELLLRPLPQVEH